MPKKITKAKVAAKPSSQATSSSSAVSSAACQTGSCCTPQKKIFLVLLRVALGWLFLYSGITKIMDPAWDASKFLIGAKTFTSFFSLFSSQENISWVNAINAWGQALIGLSLITGTLIRISSIFGILLMLLYYFPGLDFPLVKNGYLIDDHIIYALLFLLFFARRAGTAYGLDALINRKVKNMLI